MSDFIPPYPMINFITFENPIIGITNFTTFFKSTQPKRTVLSHRFPLIFLFFQLVEGGGKDHISSLISSLLSFMSFIAFVVFALEFSLVFLAFDEVLFVVLYDLSHLKLQLQWFGFSIALFMLAAVLPALVVVFAAVLRFHFLKVRTRFLRRFLSPMRPATEFTSAPTTQRRRPLHHPPSTRRSVHGSHTPVLGFVALARLSHTLEPFTLPTSVVAIFLGFFTVFMLFYLTWVIVSF